MAGFVTDEVLSKSTRSGFDVVSLRPDGEDDRRGVLSRKQKYKTPSSTIWKKTGKYHVNVTEFERIALSAMESATERTRCVLIVDEIGRMELHSEKFRHLISRLLNTPSLHIVGALTAPIYGHRVPFCDEISSRDDVKVVKITVKTRDEATRRMLDLVRRHTLCDEVEEHEEEGEKNSYVCYTIMSGSRTYVGITNNLKRRLRQHSGEIKGGARYTRGLKWKLVYFVSGFRNKREALQFEWSLRHITGHGRKGRAPGSGMSGRLHNLERVFSMKRWTSKSPLASDVPLILNWVLKKLRPDRFTTVLPQHVSEKEVVMSL